MDNNLHPNTQHLVNGLQIRGAGSNVQPQLTYKSPLDLVHHILVSHIIRKLRGES